MSDQPTHYAYCAQCVKNVPHFRRVRSRWLAGLDRHLGKYLAYFRIGPWYCLHCEQRTIIRRSARIDAVNYRIVDPTQPVPDQESSWTKVSELDRKEPDQSAESVGNFIKSDKSLVLRRTRLLRYSQKYRDSVVDRLLSGNATIADVRHEKNICERELLDWIADRLERAEQEAAMSEFREPPMLEIVPKSSEQRSG